MNYLEISILFFFILFLILFYISNYVYNLFIIQQEDINDEAFNTYNAEFDCNAYGTRYPDVKKNNYFGINCDRMKLHYDKYGKREGRNPRPFLPAPNTTYNARAGRLSDSNVTSAREARDRQQKAYESAQKALDNAKKRNDKAIADAKASVKEIVDWENERNTKFKSYYKTLRKIRHYISMQRRRMPAINNTLARLNGDVTSESNNASLDNDNSYASHMFELEKNLSTINDFMNNQEKSDQELIKLFNDVAKIVGENDLN